MHPRGVVKNPDSPLHTIPLLLDGKFDPSIICNKGKNRAEYGDTVLVKAKAAENN